MTVRAQTGHRPGAEAILPAPAPEWAYFFDIDGTLVDFDPSPSRVSLDRELRALIEALYRLSGGAVALISGRALADIDRLFTGVQMPAAGQHGLERRAADGRLVRHASPSDDLARARTELEAVVERHPDLLLEDKGLSLALHYRRSPGLGGFVHRIARSCVGRIGTGYCVQTGKRVVEMKPAGRDKGAAVSEFMAEEPFKGRVPIFVGDDVTDEYGFAAVNGLAGYAIKVGAGRTVAPWRLRNVQAVRAWLTRGVGGGTPEGAL